MENVSILEQEIYDFDINRNNENIKVRVIKAKNKPTWDTEADNDSNQLPNPIDNITNTVGWYFDLPAGERVDTDVILRDGKLIVIGFTPEVNPCLAGGRSMFMEINAFTGGNLSTVQFDVSGGGTIDSEDWVEYTKDGEVYRVPASGMQLDGKVQSAAILFSSGAGGGGW